MSILSRAVIEIFCADNDVDTDDVIDYDELLEVEWFQAYGILEYLK